MLISAWPMRAVVARVADRLDRAEDVAVPRDRLAGGADADVRLDGRGDGGVGCGVGHRATPFGKVDDREVVGGWVRAVVMRRAEAGDEPWIGLHVGIDVSEDVEPVEGIGGHRSTSS